MRAATVCVAGVLAGWMTCPLAQVPSSTTAQVQWLSEEFPPISYLESDTPKGAAVDLAAAALARAGLPAARPRFLPWARVLLVLSGPEAACVTAMTRTPERERQFQWVGPFFDATLTVSRLTRTPPLRAGDQPLAGHSVVVIRGDVSEQSARGLGASEGQIHRVANPDIAARMLLAGRVDFWIYDEAAMRHSLESLGAGQGVTTIDARQSRGAAHFACNARVSAEYVQRLQQGLDNVRLAPKGKTSEYDKIVSIYFGAKTP